MELIYWVAACSSLIGISVAFAYYFHGNAASVKDEYEALRQQFHFHQPHILVAGIAARSGAFMANRPIPLARAGPRERGGAPRAGASKRLRPQGNAARPPEKGGPRGSVSVARPILVPPPDNLRRCHEEWRAQMLCTSKWSDRGASSRFLGRPKTNCVTSK